MGMSRNLGWNSSGKGKTVTHNENNSFHLAQLTATDIVISALVLLHRSSSLSIGWIWISARTTDHL